VAGDTDLKFHTPPAWPPMPDGFIPDDGWRPAPYWGVAPADWTFYSFNGQRVSPPAGKWRPGPGDIAQPFGADSFQASRPPVPSTAIHHSRESRHLSSPWTSEAARHAVVTPSRLPRSGMIIVIVAIAIIGLAVATLLARTVQQRIAALTGEPLTHQQLVSAFDAGNVVGEVEFTSITEKGADTAFQGIVCTDMLIPLFSTESRVVSSSAGGIGVDPNTGLIAGDEYVNVDAVDLTTTAEARTAFGSAEGFGGCLATRVSGIEGQVTSTYRVTRTSNYDYILMTHGNVIALITTDPDGAGEAAKLVKDVSKLLEDAHSR
jgi:hypothetical protein